MARLNVADSERFDVSPEQHRLALERTSYLLVMPERPLQDLIANAWLQGVIDAAEHQAMKGPRR